MAPKRKRINKNCLNCGQPFEVTPCDFERRKCCSNKCMGEHFKKIRAKESNVKCENCGEWFYAQPHTFEKEYSFGRFCSWGCASKYKTQAYSGRENPNCRFHQVDDSYFSEINTLNKAYFLGLLCSDGSFTKSTIQISLHNKDAVILNKVNEDLGWELEIKQRIDNPDMSIMIIHSKQMVEDICRHLTLESYGKKSDKVGMPDLPDRQTSLSFIRGVFDGDGHVAGTNTKKKYLVCTISSNSKKLLESVNGFVYNKGCFGRDRIEWSCNKAFGFLREIYEECECELYIERKRGLYEYWKNIKQVG